MNKKDPHKLLKQQKLAQVKLNPETKLIESISNLEMYLIEECDFSEKASREIGDTLDTFCEFFHDFIKNENFEITENTVAELIRTFVREIPYNINNNFYSRAIPRNLFKLNLYLFKNFRNEIPFLYFKKNKIKLLEFFTQDQYKVFNKTLAFVRIDNKTEAFNALQCRGFFEEYNVDILISMGMEAVLSHQFNYCEVSITKEQIKRLLQFYSVENILDILSAWLPVFDNDGNILHYENPNKKCYSWTNFLIDLLVNYGPYPGSLIPHDSEKEFMKLYEGINESFQALIRVPNGMVRIVIVKSWNDYLKQVKKIADSLIPAGEHWH